MSTALALARPTLAEFLATSEDGDGVPEFFVDLYVEIRAHEPLDDEDADARARAEAVAEILENHPAFEGVAEDSLPDLPADVQDEWLAAETELTWRLSRERANHMVADKVDAYAALRSEGKTVVQAARKLDTDPGYLVALADDKLRDDQRDRIRAGRAARREDDAARAFNGRRRLLSALASKLTKEFETRDLSDVPADKLVGMLLKVSELSREDPPNVIVQGKIRSV